MSNLETHPAEAVCGADATAGPVTELLEGREVVLGGTRGIPVLRTLPNKHRRMVGAWCFVDHFGRRSRSPNIQPSSGTEPMRVPPHPHTGLQTVTWLVSGEIRHRDSLANDQVIHPGELNLMTAGRGIAHAEESPPQWSGVLHGVQLWVALPATAAGVGPRFAHHADLPSATDGAAMVRLLVGDLDGLRSPAHAYTPLFGAEVTFAGPGRTSLSLEPLFEYAVLTLDGTVEVGEVRLEAGPLLYLGTGRSSLPLAAEGPATVLLLGGEPFAEEIIMWWNFIGRDHDEIVAFREDWAAGRRFGDVTGFDGSPLAAPEMPITPLKPRGRTRS
jgi:redox-sensitive bicupin YhaK (pirin superfamily)